MTQIIYTSALSTFSVPGNSGMDSNPSTPMGASGSVYETIGSVASQQDSLQ